MITYSSPECEIRLTKATGERRSGRRPVRVRLPLAVTGEPHEGFSAVLVWTGSIKIQDYLSAENRSGTRQRPVSAFPLRPDDRLLQARSDEVFGFRR